MNARGAMEIILGLLALQYKIIEPPLFVALVVMALVTSIISGPVMKKILGLKKPRKFTEFLKSRNFICSLQSVNKKSIIKELSELLSDTAGITSAQLEEALLNREKIMSTGIGGGIAVPHARFDSISVPIVGVGITNQGIDFDAQDGNPAKIIFVILTPLKDDAIHLQILSDIAKLFNSNSKLLPKISQSSTYTEFLALINSERRMPHY